MYMGLKWIISYMVLSGSNLTWGYNGSFPTSFCHKVPNKFHSVLTLDITNNEKLIMTIVSEDDKRRFTISELKENISD